MEVTPFVIITSLLSQKLATWAYKNPDITWVNKNTIKAVSITVASVATLGVAYADGTLDAATAGGAIDAIMNAIISSGLSVAFYEWTKKKFD